MGLLFPGNLSFLKMLQRSISTTSNLNCSHDSLTLYDGNSNTAPLIYKYCYGIHLSGVFPISHISSGNEVFIHYQPNTATRFSLEYHPYSKIYSKYSLILF